MKPNGARGSSERPPRDDNKFFPLDLWSLAPAAYLRVPVDSTLPSSTPKLHRALALGPRADKSSCELSSLKG